MVLAAGELSCKSWENPEKNDDLATLFLASVLLNFFNLASAQFSCNGKTYSNLSKNHKYQQEFMV